MDYDIEKVAKDALLTFFLETTESHFNELTGLDICNVGKWLSKIYRQDVYSMRTHLLLLHHMIRKGRLLAPFNGEPELTTLPRFRATNLFTQVDTPTMNQLIRLASQKSPIETVTRASTLRGHDAHDTMTQRCELPSCSNQFMIPRRDTPYASRTSGHHGRSLSQPREGASYRVDSRRSMSSDRCLRSGAVCCNPFDVCGGNAASATAATSTPRNRTAHPPDFPVSPIRSHVSRSRIPADAREWALRQVQRVLDEQERDWYHTPCCPPGGSRVQSRTSGSASRSMIPVLQRQWRPCQRAD